MKPKNLTLSLTEETLPERPRISQDAASVVAPKTDLTSRIWDESIPVDPMVRMWVILALDVSGGVKTQPFVPHVDMLLRRPGITFEHIKEFLNFCAMPLGSDMVYEALALLRELEELHRKMGHVFPRPVPTPRQDSLAVLDDYGHLLKEYGPDPKYVHNALLAGRAVWRPNALVDSVPKLFVLLALCVHHAAGFSALEMHVRLLRRRDVTFAQIRKFLAFLLPFLAQRHPPDLLPMLDTMEMNEVLRREQRSKARGHRSSGSDSEQKNQLAAEGNGPAGGAVVPTSQHSSSLKHRRSKGLSLPGTLDEKAGDGHGGGGGGPLGLLRMLSLAAAVVGAVWTLWPNKKKKKKGGRHRGHAPVFYHVQQGDYLLKINADCQDPNSEFYKLNPEICNRNLIYPGQRIRIR
eukprot:jgi/Mesvir1/23049/Mv08166-RA.1